MQKRDAVGKVDTHRTFPVKLIWITPSHKKQEKWNSHIWSVYYVQITERVVSWPRCPPLIHTILIQAPLSLNSTQPPLFTSSIKLITCVLQHRLQKPPSHFVIKCPQQLVLRTTWIHSGHRLPHWQSLSHTPNVRVVWISGFADSAHTLVCSQGSKSYQASYEGHHHQRRYAASQHRLYTTKMNDQWIFELLVSPVFKNTGLIVCRLCFLPTPVNQSYV